MPGRAVGCEGSGGWDAGRLLPPGVSADVGDEPRPRFAPRERLVTWGGRPRAAAAAFLRSSSCALSVSPTRQAQHCFLSVPGGAAPAGVPGPRAPGVAPPRERVSSVAWRVC